MIHMEKNDLIQRMERNKQNSMFYWHPKIKDLPIAQPKTESYKFNKSEFEIIAKEEGIPTSVYENCLPIAKKIGFPLFMRTDNNSCKHFWEKTCYVPDEKVLKNHIFELISYSSMQGWMSYTDNGLFFREFIPLTTKFKAFSGFPVNKERRYFIKNGKIQCHHPYWYPDSIKDNTDFKNWEKVVSALNYETDAEIKKLSEYALIIAELFKEYWSVDFAMSKKSIWFLFDMARGEDSFHWKECKYCSNDVK